MSAKPSLSVEEITIRKARPEDADHDGVGAGLGDAAEVGRQRVAVRVQVAGDGQQVVDAAARRRVRDAQVEQAGAAGAQRDVADDRQRANAIHIARIDRAAGVKRADDGVGWHRPDGDQTAPSPH